MIGVLFIFLLIGTMVAPLLYSINKGISYKEGLNRIWKPLLWILGGYAIFTGLILYGVGQKYREECLVTIHSNFTGEKGSLQESKCHATLSLENGKTFRFIVGPQSERLIKIKLGNNLYFSKEKDRQEIIVTNTIDSMVCPIYPDNSGLFFSDLNTVKLQNAYMINATVIH